MAVNSWNALVADVNGRMSEMNAAIAEANGASSTAKTAAEHAAEAAETAKTAAAAASQSAKSAAEEAHKWSGATAEATTLPTGENATVLLTEADGVKKLTFGIPRGADGAPGQQGPMGKAGVTFRLSGTALYITTG